MYSKAITQDGTDGTQTGGEEVGYSTLGTSLAYGNAEYLHGLAGAPRTYNMVREVRGGPHPWDGSTLVTPLGTLNPNAEHALDFTFSPTASEASHSYGTVGGLNQGLAGRITFTTGTAYLVDLTCNLDQLHLPAYRSNSQLDAWNRLRIHPRQLASPTSGKAILDSTWVTTAQQPMRTWATFMANNEDGIDLGSHTGIQGYRPASWAHTGSSPTAWPNSTMEALDELHGKYGA